MHCLTGSMADFSTQPVPMPTNGQGNEHRSGAEGAMGPATSL